MAEPRFPRPLGGRRRRLYGRLCAIAFAQAAMVAGGAMLVRWTFDHIVAARSAPWPSAGYLAIVGLVTLPLVGGWLRRVERVSAEAMGQDYAHAVRLRLYDRLGTLAPRDLQARESGGHVLRFVGDLTSLQQWISLGLARVSAAAILLVVCFGVLGFIEPAIGGTIAVVIAVGTAVSWTLGRTLRASLLAARRQRGRLATDVLERVKAMTVVQAFSQVRRERRRLARRSKELREAMLARARVIGLLRGITEGVTGISSAAVLLVGAHEVAAGRTTYGTVVAALSVLHILAPSLRDIGRSYEYWHAHAVAQARIGLFLDRQPSVALEPAAPPLPEGPGRIVFEEVAAGGTLSGITVTAPAGAVVALVGPSGAGKSTLLSLIARQLEPEAGRVLIDGHDIRHHNAESIRAAIGVVGPDLPLLRGTLQRNIRYRRPRATDAEVRDICRRCGLDKVIGDLADGLETRIVEGGLNLSPGQRQRVALARALIGAPRILLLDEVDAHLDPSSSQLIDDIVRDYPGTVIFVSHRLERIVTADTVWHIDNRGLIETGPPRDLMGRDGPTRRLFGRLLESAA